MAQALIEIEGSLDTALAMLNRLGDPAEAQMGLRIVGGAIAYRTQQRIKAGGPAPDGAPWKPWSPGYAAGRRSGGGLLYDSGHLAISIVAEDRGDEELIGSNLVYAAIQQFGGKIEPKAGGHLVFQLGGKTVFAKSVTIPARPYLGVSDADIKEIEAELHDWVEGLLP